MARRRLLLAGAAAAVVAAGVGSARSAGPLPPLVLEAATPSPLLGLAVAPPYSNALVRLDPATLRRVGRGRVVLGEHDFAWSFSPGRSRLVLGDTKGDLLLVDARRLRPLGHLATGVRSQVQATQWLDASRLVAAVGWCCNVEQAKLVTIDVARRRVLSRRSLGGAVQGAAHAPQGLVLLLGPEKGIGPSRLGVAARDGTLRTVSLDRIVAGMEDVPDDAPIKRYEFPGLTVDATGSRAFVVGAGDEVAEVDLTSLEVAYHSLARNVSLLGRLHGWLESPASAKSALSGPRRYALWLRNGILAVYGTDDRASVDAAGKVRQESTPSGLRLVDTRDWSVHMLDASANLAAVAQGALVAAGSTWDSQLDRTTGTGLTVFGADGGVRAHLFGSRVVWFQVAGPRVFVALPSPETGYTIVDAAAGAVVRTLRGRPLPLVLGGLPFPY